jgi:hypothetical protein
MNEENTTIPTNTESKEAFSVVSEQKIEAPPAAPESMSCKWFGVGCNKPPTAATEAAVGGSKRKQKTSKRTKKGGRKTHKKQNKNTINKKGGRKTHRKNTNKKQ